MKDSDSINNVNDSLSDEALKTIKDIKEDIGDKVKIESFENQDLSSGIEALFLPSNNDSTCPKCNKENHEKESIIEQFTPTSEIDNDVEIEQNNELDI